MEPATFATGSGTEPVDVLDYASEALTFPQQSTEELWFNESQFESYRKLGMHAVERIAAAAPRQRTEGAVEQFVLAAEAYVRSDSPIEHSRWPKPAP